MRIFGDYLIIGNKKFKLFSISGSYLLSRYRREEDINKEVYYVFGERSYRDLTISDYSDGKTLSQLFRDYGFEVNVMANIREQKKNPEINPFSFNSLPEVIGSFSIRLYRHRLGQFWGVIEKLRREHSYRVLWLYSGDLQVIL